MWYQDNHWSNYKLGIFFFDNKLLNGIINKKKAFDQFLLRQLEDQLSFTLRPIKRNIETCVFRDIIRCLLDQTLCFGHGLVWFLINMLSSSHLQQLIRPTFFSQRIFQVLHLFDFPCNLTFNLHEKSFFSILREKLQRVSRSPAQYKFTREF